MTPPHKIPAFAVIIRAMRAERAALNELFRRGLWLSEDQARAAIAAGGLIVENMSQYDTDSDGWSFGRLGGPLDDDCFPTEKEARDAALRSLGYERAPVPVEARPELPVIFRADPGVKAALGKGDWHEITAVFPTMPGNNDPSTFAVYAHVGQHGTGSKGWYWGTRAATPEEYADLLAELRSIYERDDDPDASRLVVRQRFTRRHDDQRRQELERMRG